MTPSSRFGHIPAPLAEVNVEGELTTNLAKEGSHVIRSVVQLGGHDAQTMVRVHGGATTWSLHATVC